MISRSVHHYRWRRWNQTPLLTRNEDIAAIRVRYGYHRIHVLLHREGWRVTHKRMYRFYRQEGLSLFERRHRSARQRQARPAAQRMNDCWSMDFASDQLYHGRKLWALTLIDASSRGCLAT